jgi:hypothetical protein
MSLVVLLAGVVFAFAGENVKLTGYLIDNACSARAKGENGVEKVKNHTVKCAQMPPCAKSGYSLVTDDGKLFKLDEEGNKKAAEILAATKKDKGVSVNVEGMLDGDTIKVTSISETQ